MILDIMGLVGPFLLLLILFYIPLGFLVSVAFAPTPQPTDIVGMAAEVVTAVMRAMK